MSSVDPTTTKVSSEPLTNAKRYGGRVHGQISLLSVATAVAWVGCVAVGILGLWIPYARPQVPAKTPPPVEAQILNVELTKDQMPPLDPLPRVADTTQPPPLADPVAVPDLPALMAVAEPGPALAFALPVEGPVRLVEAKRAAYTRDTEPKAATPLASSLPLQTITYGQGAGKQPAPDYPSRAAREGQEGTVRVRFSVGENGRVLEAETAMACPWHLLNDAAVRAVRERWRFPAGPLRRYEVAIRFELTK